MTVHEKKLRYDFLAPYRPRFQRQWMIGDYIADFYCAKARLVIELDGSQHAEPENIAYDEKRSRFMADSGILVIRFWNCDIQNSFDYVRDEIDRIVDLRLKELGYPSRV